MASRRFARNLNGRGITNSGKRWYKGGLHYLLTNDAYTGNRRLGPDFEGRQEA